jgi:hypothetical protein
MIRGAVFAWAIVFLILSASRGIWVPFLIIILAIGVLFCKKWISYKWEEYCDNKRWEILEQREKRGRRFKHTLGTRLKDLWQDIIYEIKQPWD